MPRSYLFIVVEMEVKKNLLNFLFECVCMTCRDLIMIDRLTQKMATWIVFSVESPQIFDKRVKER